MKCNYEDCCIGDDYWCECTNCGNKIHGRVTSSDLNKLDITCMGKTIKAISLSPKVEGLDEKDKRIEELESSLKLMNSIYNEDLAIKKELEKEVERLTGATLDLIRENENLETENERLRGLVEEAHLNGFKISCEGWNGEYPFNELTEHIKTNKTYNKYLDQFKANNNL